MAPGVRDLTALENDVVDRARAKMMAGREPGVPGADDDRGDALDGRFPSATERSAPQATSTVTFVGFVNASKTAERFWD